ncbi:MAG: hypothetical protein ABSF44_04600 [Candidatus Bathyarchaeia archaeon]|jgi:heme/copper-type cytochrome/quinol oxidase subunit 4
MDLQLVVRLVGIAIIDIIIFYVAYLFYDKSRTTSFAALVLALLITLAYVLSTLYFRNKTKLSSKGNGPSD